MRHERLTIPSPGVSVNPPASSRDLERTKPFPGCSWPDDYVELLLTLNGGIFCGGHFGIFGLTEGLLSVEDWNELDHWKFAWGARLHDFVCVAETGFGDQFAYKGSDLASGVRGSRLYMLDALEMTPTEVEGGLTGLLERTMEDPSTPGDPMEQAALEKLGPLPAASHVAYAPSLLLGGEESVAKMTMLPSRFNMIFNGDIWTQLQKMPASALIKGVELVVDSQGRQRLRVTTIEK